MPDSEASVPKSQSAFVRAWQARTLSLITELLDALEDADRQRRGRLLVGVGDADLHEALLTLVMRTAVTLFGRGRGLRTRGGRLFANPPGGLLARIAAASEARLSEQLNQRAVEALGFVQLADGRQPVPYAELPVEQIGSLYEHLLRTQITGRAKRGRWQLTEAKTRKRSGSFYTPRGLTQIVVQAALTDHLRTSAATSPRQHDDRLLALRICDPAMGAGAFLLEVCRQLAAEVERARARAGKRADPIASRRAVAQHCLYGVDVSALTVAVAEASIWLCIRDPRLTLDEAAPHLRRGDALVGLDAEGWTRLDPSARARQRSDSRTLELFAANEETTAHWCDDADLARSAADLVVGAALLASPSTRSAARARWIAEARQAALTLCSMPGRRTGLRKDDPRVTAARSALAFHWALEFPEIFRERGGFDVVITNPPWVAFAGRAAQPLAPVRRAYYAHAFNAWRGYPTLHGLFAERCARLAPSGVVALVVPSPMADLDGYRATRAAVTTRHVVREPLLEFGQDAFSEVTQPCFALIAGPSPEATPSQARWKLAERQRAAGTAEQVRVPEVLGLLADAPSLPRALFGEMGFQSTGTVTKTLFLRAPEPDKLHRYPLLEGRNVREFEEDAPRLFLRADRELLRKAGVRIRPQSDYRKVSFVVRQTAAMPIAALHCGLPFRNSLLAGFALDELSAELAVGLLNSALYRALHLASQRDARQAAFPQVKIRHLRALPGPAPLESLRRKVAKLARKATSQGITNALRAELDDAVFDLFALPPDHRAAVLDFLARRAPKLGYAQSGTADHEPRASLDPVRRRLRI